MNIETVKLSEKYGIEGNATLKCFVHDRDEEMKRYNVDLPAMIVCPGGGYCFTSRREADPIAVEFYNRKYATFVLNYDVAPYRYPVALTELAAAVDYVRSNAEKFSVNPNRIFVVGFSAGDTSSQTSQISGIICPCLRRTVKNSTQSRTRRFSVIR